MFGILKSITDLFGGASKVVDSVNLPQVEKEKLRHEMLKLETEATVKVREYEKEILTKNLELAKAEAESDSWLTKSWRPITSLIFASHILLYGYGVISFSEEIIFAMFGFLGVYGVGRSAEKRITNKLFGKDKG